LAKSQFSDAIAPILIGLGNQLKNEASMTDNIGRVVREGPAATIFALKALAKAGPFTIPAAGGTGTPLKLYPGQRLSDGGVILGNLDGIHIFVARDNKIYESIASSFASRTLEINDVAHRAQSSAWLETLGKAEGEFIFVTAATLVGTIGTAVAVSQFVCGLTDQYYNHKREIDLVRQYIAPIAAAIAKFRKSCPVLFNYLVQVFIGASGDALGHAWQGVTLEDVAYFAGKFAAYAIKSRGDFALGLKEAVHWTMLIRSAGIGTRSLAVELEKTCARLRALGKTDVGRKELEDLANSACVLKPETQQSLQHLTHNLEILVRNLQPFLEAVSPSM
jgi:hypothetical protein